MRELATFVESSLHVSPCQLSSSSPSSCGASYSTPSMPDHESLFVPSLPSPVVSGHSSSQTSDTSDLPTHETMERVRILYIFLINNSVEMVDMSEH